MMLCCFPLSLRGASAWDRETAPSFTQDYPSSMSDSEFGGHSFLESRFLVEAESSGLGCGTKRMTGSFPVGSVGVFGAGVEMVSYPSVLLMAVVSSKVLVASVRTKD